LLFARYDAEGNNLGQRFNMSAARAESELLSELDAGDPVLDQQQSLDRFLASVEQRAYKMAQIATRGHEDSLDIVQDAMLALVQKYSHRPRDEWPPLFFRILQSRIRDWYRRQRVRTRWRVLPRGDHDDAGPDPLHAIPDPAQAGPLEMATLDESTDVVLRAIERLPMRQQQAFLLRAWEGLDVKSTAFAMRCSEGSVKTHYSRALKSLRAALEM